MRNVPSYIADRLKKNIQTRATDSAPSARIWISRPSTVLVDERLLERQTVLNSSITDVSIAVGHPRMKRSNADIFVAYISNGVAKVATSLHKLSMDAHSWRDTGFNEDATAVSIAFDGTMPKVYGTEVEFVTEKDPWVFWVCGSVLYGRKLYSKEDPIILAETNCSDVSAIRAMWSSTGDFDFGLVVFFILEGKLYYRQLINGVWMDAELVSFGPPGVTWNKVAAFRTWDYRVGVQAEASDGSVYELFTQFMGIGKQTAEHLEISDIKASSEMIEVKYSTTQDTERLELSQISAGFPYGGLYSLDPPILVSAQNLEDENGDWGTLIRVVSNVHLASEQVVDNHLQFALVDSWGAAYYPTSATLEPDGKTIVLRFVDFNPAYGVCEVQYTPGTVYSMATVRMGDTSISFTPQNLNPPDIPQPEVESIWNE